MIYRIEIFIKIRDPFLVFKYVFDNTKTIFKKRNKAIDNLIERKRFQRWRHKAPVRDISTL